MKQYKAIVFDWDGTAVLTRSAPVDDVIPLMVGLLRKGVLLNIISGTTWEKICDGCLHEQIPVELRGNLFMGLGRGAYNYGFDEAGGPRILQHMIPDRKGLATVHEGAFAVHRHLLRRYGFPTDIVFTRPNYCKIDLLVNLDRGEALYLQPTEISQLKRELERHGFPGGIKGLMDEALEVSRSFGLGLKATTDAKYLELGLSTKGNNVDYFLTEVAFPRGVRIEDCCFWGDEFTFLDEGVPGSDALMLTELASGADFFDVSAQPERLPDRVQSVGGGVESFLRFLESQLKEA